MNNKTSQKIYAPIHAIVPAAGVGSRMKAALPKQYLLINKKTILEHTVEKLLANSEIKQVIVAISEEDPYFDKLPLATNPRVTRVNGGSQRADSVLSAINYLTSQLPLVKESSQPINSCRCWVLVHDAARPCVSQNDINKLIESAVNHPVGAILASKVRDTMKLGDDLSQICQTVDRENLWHALTPQMFNLYQLKAALEGALKQGVAITDEASAMEWLGLQPKLVAGRSDNLKITQPEDLALAEFYLQRNSELSN